MPRGGKRPGAGKPKGYKHPHTLEKAAARAILEQLVYDQIQPVVGAQLRNARGIQHFVLRDSAGKFQKVTSAEAAVAAMNDPNSVWEFWTRDPNVQAAAYLLDQALDKAAQPQKITGEDGGPVEHVFSWKR